jgi:hypothetical protein
MWAGGWFYLETEEVMEDPQVMITSVVFGLLIYLAAFTTMGLYVANAKGRGDAEGAIFAVLFGPLGLLLVACLPTVEKKEAKPVGTANGMPPRISDAEHARRQRENPDARRERVRLKRLQESERAGKPLGGEVDE